MTQHSPYSTGFQTIIPVFIISCLFSCTTLFGSTDDQDDDSKTNVTKLYKKTKELESEIAALHSEIQSIKEQTAKAFRYVEMNSKANNSSLDIPKETQQTPPTPANFMKDDK